MALLVLRRVGLCVGQKTNVPFVRLAKIVFKKCAVEKIKIQKRWQYGRLFVGSYVRSLYV
jgi:hypothetical protein